MSYQSHKLVFILLLVYVAYEFRTLSHAYILLNENTDDTLIITKINETIWINCTTLHPIIFCHIFNPEGHRMEHVYHDINQVLCSLKVQVKMTDAGKWSCHYSTLANHLVKVQPYMVRVVEGNVTAVEKNVTKDLGTQITLHCVTVIQEPMIYCRFDLPSGLGFSIDESVTHNNSIGHMYYYPLGKHIKNGDCSVTIKKFEKEHVGEWTCAGGFVNGREYADTIYVDHNELWPVWREHGVLGSAHTHWTLWEKYRMAVWFCFLVIIGMACPIIIIMV